MAGALKVKTSTDPDVWTVLGGGSFATEAETVAGVLDDRAVTPAGYGKAQPFFDVRRFGAKGDGTTNDTPAVQAAIDAAAAVGGGEVRIPAGTFLLSGTIHVAALTLKTGVTLRGVGRASILKRNPTAPGGVVAAVSQSHVSIRDLTCSSAADEVASPDGLAGSGHDGVRFANCDNITIDQVRVERCLGFALVLYTCSDASITSISFDTGGDRAGGGVDGLHLLSCQRIVVRGVQGISGDNLIGITSQGADCHDIQISGVVGRTLLEFALVQISQETADTSNSIYDITLRDIRCTSSGPPLNIHNVGFAGTGRIHHIVVDGVSASAVGAGNAVILDHVDNFKLVNVHVEAGLQQGVYANGCNNGQFVNCVANRFGNSGVQRNGFDIVNCSRFQFVNCRANNNSFAGFQFYDCASFDVTNCVAADNGTPGLGFGFRLFASTPGSTHDIHLAACSGYSTAPGTFTQLRGADFTDNVTASTLVACNFWDNTANVNGNPMLGFYGVTPVVRPTGVSPKVALELLGLGATLVEGDLRDTGARNMPLINGWTTGSVTKLRRVGTMVTLDFSVLNGSAATASDIVVLPVGFRNNVTTVIPMWDGAGFTPVISRGAGGAVDTGSRNNGMYSSMSWHTVDPWPSSLPGTPIG